MTLKLLALLFVLCMVTKVNTKETKIAWMYPGPIKDYGWNNAMENGRTYVDTQLFNLGYDPVSSFEQNIGSFPEDTENANVIIEKYLEEDFDMIIGGSFFWMDSFVNYSLANPDVKFLHFTGYKQTPNMNSLFMKSYQAFYIAGMICAKMTETNHIGFIAPFRIAEVIRQLNAYYIGAGMINSDIEVSVIWTDDWYSPLVEAEAARRLFDLGCDCMTGSQDSSAIPEIGAELGFWTVGYTGDFRIVSGETTLTSIILGWGPLVLEPVLNMLNDTWVQEDIWKGFEVGAISFAPYSTLMPNSVKSIIQEEQQLFEAGIDTVFCPPNLPLSLGIDHCLTDFELHTIDWVFDSVDEVGSLAYADVVEFLYVDYTSTIGIAILVVVGILLLICLLFFIDLAIYRNTIPYQVSSIPFSVFILVGNILGITSVIFWVVNPSDVICNMRLWIFGLGYIFVYGNLFAKNYRIERIFKTNRVDTKGMGNFKLFYNYVLIVIVVELIVMAAWTILDPLKRVEVTGVGQLQINQIYVGCASNTIWGMAAFVVYNMFMLFIGAAMAYRARKVPGEYSEMNVMTLITYNAIIVSFLTIVLMFMLTNTYPLDTIVSCLGILILFATSLLVIFIPKAWNVHVRGVSDLALSNNTRRTITASKRTRDYSKGHSKSNTRVAKSESDSPVAPKPKKSKRSVEMVVEFKADSEDKKSSTKESTKIKNEPSSTSSSIATMYSDSS